MLAGDSLLQGLAQIAQHMPAVEDMHCPGRPLPDALAVDLGPVAGDDLDAGMAPEPVSNGVCVAIGQELRDGVAFQIDDDRSVAAPAPPGPLVDGDDAWQPWYRGRPGPHHAEEGGWAGRERQPVGQSCGRRSAEGEAEMPLHILKPSGAPGARDGDVRQALAEGAAGADGVAAAQASQAHA
ncbi:hypothetical protein GCM10007890_10530 [Methylobacterium tardum]|uniref:Uncharacterized protein n=1 Tax=Methylobacterium tardum TaxID=374432 RepID=A0AA37WQB5_9HYPH|nr:hypothetical protein [Methylobacterium tardum]GLS69041.1 hypothetical protein GCM10007890_10530 [Methylobacterium tardum]